MTRLFVALRIPDKILDEIISFRDQAYKGSEKFRWEKKDKLHLTLKFIVEVEDQKVAGIAKELEFIENYQGFNCRLNGFGFFRYRGVPKILWTGLHTSEKIFTLADELNSRLEKFSIPKEKRKVKTHITILRIKGNPGENFIEGFEKFSIPQNLFTCNNVALIKSELRPGGSVYNEIRNYKLKDMEEG
jgi:2'-5' RNA ligase